MWIFGGKADVTHGIRVNKNPELSPEGFPTTNNQAACFLFLRQPIGPNAPRPVAKSGCLLYPR